MICPHCKVEVGVSDKFCRGCGCALWPGEDEAVPTVQPTTPVGENPSYDSADAALSADVATSGRTRQPRVWGVVLAMLLCLSILGVILGAQKPKSKPALSVSGTATAPPKVSPAASKVPAPPSRVEQLAEDLRRQNTKTEPDGRRYGVDYVKVYLFEHNYYAVMIAGYEESEAITYLLRYRANKHDWVEAPLYDDPDGGDIPVIDTRTFARRWKIPKGTIKGWLAVAERTFQAQKSKSDESIAAATPTPDASTIGESPQTRVRILLPWNKIDLYVPQNGNIHVAANILNGLREAKAPITSVTIPAGTVQQAPQQYYGLGVTVHGVATAIQCCPVGDSISEQLGGSEYTAISMNCDDGTYVMAYLLGTVSGLPEREPISVTGFPVGLFQTERGVDALILVGDGRR